MNVVYRQKKKKKQEKKKNSYKLSQVSTIQTGQQ